jgi:hypothetical protein
VFRKDDKIIEGASSMIGYRLVMGSTRSAMSMLSVMVVGLNMTAYEVEVPGKIENEKARAIFMAVPQVTQIVICYGVMRCLVWSRFDRRQMVCLVMLLMIATPLLVTGKSKILDLDFSKNLILSLVGYLLVGLLYSLVMCVALTEILRGVH